MTAPIRASDRRGRLLLLLTLTAGMVASSAAAAPTVPPNASFTATPNPAGVGETVNFDGSASTGDGLGGTIANYRWDLDGDGTFETISGTTPTTSRAYANPATIDVVLRVTDNEGDTDDATVSLQVLGAPPDATFTFAPPTPTTGEVVSFDGTASTPPSGETIDTSEWDLDGDGQFDDATGLTTQFAFATPGPRTVSLRVVSSGGGSDVASQVVQVGNRAPDASFTFSPNSPQAGVGVELSSTSSDPDSAIVDQSWDLDGDGEYDDAQGATAKRSFSEPGSFKVGLRVRDIEGATDEAIATIEVTPEALDLMSPFPVVRLSGRVTRGGATEIERLAVRAPQGSKVTVRCKGKSCPFEKRARTAKRARVRFHGIEGRFAPGALIEIFVTDPDLIGKYTRFKLRNHKVPKRTDGCVIGEAREPTSCPRS